MEIERGGRIKLAKYVNISEPIEIRFSVDGECDYSFSCFGIGKNNKLTDKDYFLVKNHCSSPDGAVTMKSDKKNAVFMVQLEKFPETIEKIVYVITVENGMMNSIERLTAKVGNSGEEKINLSLTARDFMSENSVIILEIYRHDGWKISATAQGFNRGLECTLEYFGVDDELIEYVKRLSDDENLDEPTAEITESKTEIAEIIESVTEQIEESEEIILPPVYEIENAIPPVQTLQSSDLEGYEGDEEEEEDVMPPSETAETIPPVQTLQPSDLEGYVGDEEEEEDVMPPSEKADEQTNSSEWIFDADTEELPPVRTLEIEEPKATVEKTDNSSEWIFDADETAKKNTFVRTSETVDFTSENSTVALQADEKNLSGVVARVALVMDMTGSMRRSYASGLVQRVIEKILPLALKFDDDGQLDFWYYANGFIRRPTITAENCKTVVPFDWNLIMDSLGIVNNEPAVIEDVMRKFSQTKLPVYVIFVTDGGAVYPQRIAQLLREASYMPIYWQFVGINGSNYSIFENLDMINNRCVNNAGFFALDDLASISDDYLYDRLLSGFAIWNKEIKRLGMI